MKRSLRVGSVAGIGIFLHWTFLLLVAAIFAYYYVQSQSLGAALSGMGLILGVFVCVILHELGHALTARRFGVPTRSITLYPIGGLARLERIPSEPMKEFWIAIGGPAVNVVIAFALALVLLVTGGTLAPVALEAPGSHALASLMWINAVLAVFNMLPAFPMDGGRVLRALLALRWDYAQATQTAANVGQGMAVLFGLVGIMTWNPVLLFIALFVYVGAQQESKQAMYRAFTEGTPVREATVTRFATLTVDDTLDDAVDALLAGTDHDFPVLEAGTVVGLLRRKQLIQALSEHGRDTPVAEVADADCFTTAPSAPLDEVFQQMNARSCSTVPVVDGGQLVGLLTLENVGELIMVSSALETRSHSRVPRDQLSEAPLRERPDGAASSGAPPVP
ncbi:site-2 protease family protein [Salinibacter ruber]|uniref:Zinc metalloprotease n=1 Tax=Salinibacter ruber TaxID=146919 RepID=A0A9X2ZCP8_9BACT|nr:site-2 protease family protein [Salinibacter ruber]MCS3613313.1 Zn-dependent protease/CBS domain-containing protein [Salinibacter ruber]MCS3616599.1 Zn-dependent protease/CBS domain-containing protein [Salinibacter ruber]MCS3675861.1 Zn-dependent protease/CBS domain-containing protein [Salinibacter ruber]MCS3785625.1 Zn-dependent protease/CBS domain-containing protein [Salinibacter ruber]MCS4037975.1 Zn-dependent protease/CBS domain-containing protein [Salinibacter ruber]